MPYNQHQGKIFDVPEDLVSEFSRINQEISSAEEKFKTILQTDELLKMQKFSSTLTKMSMTKDDKVSVFSEFIRVFEDIIYERDWL